MTVRTGVNQDSAQHKGCEEENPAHENPKGGEKNHENPKYLFDAARMMVEKDIGYVVVKKGGGRICTSPSR